ncbi:MAG: hypothetical protein M1294_03825 [Firmicutes bacterium]|jgi:hypothetical protein|nr:hypothetical protein [Bacillota bacterium]
MHPIHVIVTDWPVGWASIILNTILAGATLIYVILTRQLVLADRQAEVTVRLYHNPDRINFILLEIRNIGPAVARDISITFDPDAKLSSQKTLTQALGNIPLLLPNEALPPVYLGNAVLSEELKERFPNLSVTVEVSWKDALHRKMPRKEGPFQLNLLQYEGVVVAGGKDDVTKALDRLGNALAMTRLFEDGWSKQRKHQVRRLVVAPYNQPVRTDVWHNTALWIRQGGAWSRILPKRVVRIFGRDYTSPIVSPKGNTKFESNRVNDEFLYVYLAKNMMVDYGTKLYILVDYHRFTGLVENVITDFGGLHADEQQVLIQISRELLRREVPLPLKENRHS